MIPEVGALQFIKRGLLPTRKLLDRIKPSSINGPPESTTALGPWYATIVFWKPQVALLVNEQTVLPVLMPLAPAASLEPRFARALAEVLAAHQVPQAFIETELIRMDLITYAKVANRSVLGIMNEFIFLAGVYRDRFTKARSRLSKHCRI